jgi:hypothetical protein
VEEESYLKGVIDMIRNHTVGLVAALVVSNLMWLAYAGSDDSSRQIKSLNEKINQQVGQLAEKDTQLAEKDTKFIDLYERLNVKESGSTATGVTSSTSGVTSSTSGVVHLPRWPKENQDGTQFLAITGIGTMHVETVEGDIFKCGMRAAKDDLAKTLSQTLNASISLNSGVDPNDYPSQGFCDSIRHTIGE